MPDEEYQSMDAARLEKVAHYLYPDAGRNWKSRVAKQMHVNVSTVRRWCYNNRVPPGYDQALECYAARKHEILNERSKGE